MINEILAIVFSTTFVLIFGEIVPQAVCTGPNQLLIAYRLSPILNLIMIILYPLSWPIAKVLDFFIDAHNDDFKFKHEDLKALVSIHRSPS